MRTIWRATLLAVLGGVGLSGVAQPAARPAAAFDLSGPWQGVFAVDLSTTYLADVDLQRTDDHGGLSGEIHFTLVVQAARAKMAAPMEGSWRVVGTANPASR